MTKKLYIETVGCQMNVLDSELVVGSLRRQGYELTHEPTEADVIFFNTCSVRQHAEDKIYSALGRLRASQDAPSRQGHRRPRLHGPEGPGADPQAGPARRHHLRHRPAGAAAGADRARSQKHAASRKSPLSLDRTEASRHEVERSFESYDPLRDPSMRPTPFQAYVRIMIGCDKFCTYCIVPSVRGPEQSRPPEHIAAEVRQLAGEGCKEITLLGQTVNSYQLCPRRRPAANACPTCCCAFTTRRASNASSSSPTSPSDMTDDLLDAVRDSAEGLPVSARAGPVGLQRRPQAHEAAVHGRILPRHAGPLPGTVPGVAVSSDFIVGFCGETEESFEQTCDLVRDGQIQEQLHLQVQPAARHQGRRAVRRRRARGGQEAAQQRPAGHPKRRQPGRPSPLDRPHASRSWSRGRARRRSSTTRARARSNSQAGRRRTTSSSSTATNG